MKSLTEQFEDCLWACCPVPEWDYLCLDEICPKCGKPIIRTTLWMDGAPLDTPVERDFHLSKVKKNKNKLEPFCRKIVQETIDVIEMSIGKSIDEMRGNK